MNFVRKTVIAFAFAGVMLIPAASHAQTQSISDMLALIQKLTAQIQELQKQLGQVRGEIRVTIKENLREGMIDEDIKKIQEVLASDSEIYPEGMVTGYFGPLTKGAIMRLEERHGLKPTGEISSTTKALLEGYLGERFGDKIPPGLLRAPGIIKKIEDRLCDNSGPGKATGPFCKKAIPRDDDADDDTDDNANDDANDDDTEFELKKVSVSNGWSTIGLMHDGDNYRVRVSSIELGKILEKIASRIGEDVEDFDDDFVSELEEALEDAVEEDSDVDYEIEELDVSGDNVTIEFEYDNDDYEVDSSLLNTVNQILTQVANEIEEDLEDLDQDFVDELSEMLEDLLGFSDIEVEVEDDTTTVTFTHRDDDYTVEVDSTEEEDILDALADELDVDDTDDLDEDFVEEVLELLEEALSDEE